MSYNQAWNGTDPVPTHSSQGASISDCTFAPGTDPFHGQPRVTQVHVVRYRYNGKTYATRDSAYYQIAKEQIELELRWLAKSLPDEPRTLLRIMGPRNRMDRALAIKFPPRCGKRNTGRQNFKAIQHGGSEGYCRGCVYDARRELAAKLMKEEDGRAE